MFIKMKMFNVYILAAILVLLNGCQTSEKPIKQASRATSVELSSTELKAYDDALEAVKAGRAESAIPTLIKITNSHPDHVGARINLANSYLITKKIQDAENALSHVLTIKPTVAEAFNLQGLIEVEKSEYNKAEKNYLAAIQQRESYAFAHYNLALLYDVFYQTPDQALPHYERYLELAGDGDKATKNWVAELKQKISRRNKQ